MHFTCPCADAKGGYKASFCSSYDADFLRLNFHPLVADQLPCVMSERGGVERNLLNLFVRDIGCNSCGPTDCAHRQTELSVGSRCSARVLARCCLVH